MTPDHPDEGPLGPVDPFADPDIWSTDDEPAPPPAAPRPPSSPAPAPAPAPATAPAPGAVGAAPVGQRRGPRRPGGGPEAPRAPRPPRAERPRRPADDDEWVDLPAESRIPRWLVALLVVGGLLAAVVLGGRWWYGNQVDPPGEPGSVVAIQVAEGTSASGVANLMADDGVITNATLFNLWVGGKGLEPVQAGTYELREAMSFQEAVDALNAGPEAPVVANTTKVTIPEGFTVAKIVARIAEAVPRIPAAELQAALDEGKVPSSLKPEGTNNYEGLLFPATYEVGEDDDAVDVLTMMAAEMETRVTALGIDDAIAHVRDQWGLELSAYDMLKVASMIQYEAAVPEDGPKIGAVTYNRLEQGIPLGYDATSVYEAALVGKAPGDIDYEVDTPYNTRTRTGLPPTPIAAPGEFAIEGAFLPEDGPWLYFVVTEPRVVSFSETYEQFLADKQLCIERDLGCG